MIGNNIKRLRTEKGMTQKQLADMLFVSAQAISRWENNEVEPSLGTITELSKIFEVSADEILGLGKAEPAPAPEPEIVVEKEYVYKEPPRQQLALCVCCNSPIYEKKDICREADDRILCKKCHTRKKEEEKQKKIALSEKKRTASFWWGGAAAVAALMLAAALGGFGDFLPALYSVAFAISAFTFISCCILANNFVGGMTLEIFSWGFVKMPGLIFTLDLDGIIWLISVKILLAILGFLLALAFGVLAVLLGCAISLIVYPFAIHKNIQHPEEIDLF